MSEADVQAEIRLALGREPDLRLWRNNRGEAWMGKVIDKGASTVTLLHPRRVNFGLTDGASDLVGIKRVVVTPAMVGSVLGVFSTIEVKAGRGRPSEAQDKFIRFVLGFGGLAGAAWTVDDARQVLGVAG